MQSAPALVGLGVAWGGTALLAGPAVRIIARSQLTRGVLAQVVLWGLFAAVLGIVLQWEKQPLGSFWLRPLEWQSIAWGCVWSLVSVIVVFPATEWVRKAAGLAGYAKGMETALACPIWLRVIAVITAGVVEETLFRGFAVTRLLMLTGSLLAAVCLSSVVFAALHVPVWGVGPSLAFLLGGLATTVFFVWRKDLLAMILAHVFIDAWGLIVTPLTSRWWE